MVVVLRTIGYSLNVRIKIVNLVIIYVSFGNVRFASFLLLFLSNITFCLNTESGGGAVLSAVA